MTWAKGLVDARAVDWLDVDGRPLGEVASARYDPAATRVVACPYPDRRRGLPMNASALGQVGPVWSATLAAVRALAEALRAAAHREAPTVHDAWLIALAGISGPLRTGEPVPVATSALYKTSLGLSQITTHLLLAGDGVADTPFAELGSGAAWFDALDQGGWLLGAAQVCAGTRAMFVELGDALAGRAPLAGAPSAPGLDLDTARVAAGTVAGHAVELLHVDRARRAGKPFGAVSLPPWLRSLRSIPDRDPAEMLRLFPTGAAPPSVEWAIAHPPADEPASRARIAALGSAEAVGELLHLGADRPGLLGAVPRERVV
ncbi:MAG: hypothetical protein ABMA64_06520 [Myxococcota bacterium]